MPPPRFCRPGSFDTPCYIAGPPLVTHPATLQARQWPDVPCHRARSQHCATLVLSRPVSPLAWPNHNDEKRDKTLNRRQWLAQTTDNDICKYRLLSLVQLSTPMPSRLWRHAWLMRDADDRLAVAEEDDKLQQNWRRVDFRGSDFWVFWIFQI